jgi:hypothetical protein
MGHGMYCLLYLQSCMLDVRCALQPRDSSMLEVQLTNQYSPSQYPMCLTALVFERYEDTNAMTNVDCYASRSVAK